MKLWEKGYAIEDRITRFTVGNDREFDLKLAKYDVLGSIAHAKMLHQAGLLSGEEKDSLEKELTILLQQITAGEFDIEEEFEDVHSKVEFELTEKLGDTGKKIHTARSRNDQVLVDLHMFIKDETLELINITRHLFDRLLELANTHKDILLPGYTHFQIAMPSSFGLWFSAYAEAFVDDVMQLRTAFHTSDQNPLGSAAGYGSSFPIHRSVTTEELGFSTMKYNVVAAQMSRGKLERVMSFALASLAGTLSKFAMDVCLYNSQNFGFISFPDSLTTGSSIMPHKKNPDVFELIRGKTNQIQALPTEIMLITNNLPSGYHRDFQLLKEHLFPAIETMKDCLEIADYMLSHILINKEAIDNPLYDHLYTVENVNQEVLSGLTFRDAYRKVGKDVREGRYTPNKNLTHTHEGSIGNLCLDKIREKFEWASRL